jgi:uncharacterized membrane protein YphA (DoxX/SURF4 family)
MNRKTIFRVLVWAARLVLAGVFIVAALPKIGYPHEFAHAIFRYQIAPYSTVNIGALFIPWLELIAAMLLLFAPRWRSAAAIVLMVLLLFFVVMIGVALSRSIDIGCGCFSIDPNAHRIGMLSIYRNLGLLLCGVLSLLGSLSRALVKC